ncbi:MAG: N-acetylmuramoyl-L-alanine amidase [bacterium]
MIIKRTKKKFPLPFLVFFSLTFLFIQGCTLPKKENTADNHYNEVGKFKKQACSLRCNDYLLISSPLFTFEPLPLKGKPFDNLVTSKPEGQSLIMIDPGHGGEDFGGKGQGGSLEKKVVFEIAQKLVSIINKNPKMRAILSREADYYISLRDRIEIAKNNQADFLISIHANAYEDNKAHGTSVYCLTTNGSSDDFSELLAEKENASEILDAFSLKENELLTNVLTDLVNDHTLNESITLASSILNSLSTYNEIKNNGLLRANFLVLRSSAIPSILIETAFITNKTEEQKLCDKTFQNKIAQYMYEGINAYLKR